MPTLAQGASVDLTFNADSTLTIQNPGGFAIVESPIGTRIWAGGQAIRQIDLKSGAVRITATTGDLFYELVSDPINGNPVVVDPVTKALYSNGSQIAVAGFSGCSIPRILPSSGTLADNGVLTLNTALNIATFPYQCYMHFAGFVGSASFSGTTMTVTGVVSGNLVVGSVIAGVGIPNGTKITAFVSGLGGTGTYTISNSVTSGVVSVRASVLGYRPNGTVPDEGMYYVVMSSTTAGVVYDNFNDPRTGVVPTIPATPTAFVLTAGGAYTQVINTSTNSNIPIASVLIPGGTMGANGSARMSVLRNWINNANTKTFTVLSGSSTLATGGDATGGAITSPYTLWNQGSQIKNVMVGAGLGDSLGSSAYNQTNLDTSQNVVILFCGRLNVATDWTLVGASKLAIDPFI